LAGDGGPERLFLPALCVVENMFSCIDVNFVFFLFFFFYWWCFEVLCSHCLFGFVSVVCGICLVVVVPLFLFLASPWRFLWCFLRPLYRFCVRTSSGEREVLSVWRRRTREEMEVEKSIMWLEEEWGGKFCLCDEVSRHCFAVGTIAPIFIMYRVFWFGSFVSPPGHSASSFTNGGSHSAAPGQGH
jgi:hypothetical protein